MTILKLLHGPLQFLTECLPVPVDFTQSSVTARLRERHQVLDPLHLVEFQTEDGGEIFGRTLERIAFMRSAFSRRSRSTSMVRSTTSRSQISSRMSAGVTAFKISVTSCS